MHFFLSQVNSLVSHRTQITATRNMTTASEAASRLFCKQRNRTCLGRLGHLTRLIIIYQYALSSKFFSIAIFYLFESDGLSLVGV
jgi:hypothetical protein